MKQSGGHKGYQLKRRPKEYPRLPQQQKLLDALEFCGIRKGISKKELQEKMVNCLPEYYQKHKEHKDDDKGLHGEELQAVQGD